MKKLTQKIKNKLYKWCYHIGILFNMPLTYYLFNGVIAFGPLEFQFLVKIRSSRRLMRHVWGSLDEAKEQFEEQKD